MMRDPARRTSWWLMGGVVCALLALVLWAWRVDDRPPVPDGAVARPSGWLGARDLAPTSSSGTADAPPGAPPGAATSPMQAASPTSASPLDTMALPSFRATEQGRLVMDQRTRLDVERIQALFPREQALRILAEQSRELPPMAQRELRDLYLLYTQYAQAVAQSFPHATPGATLDETARQFDALRALRRQYFGEEGAQALFGEEEKTTLGLFELMRKQTDPALPLPERAEQAQEAWKRGH